MKKFLIVLVSIIALVCIGMTFYQFAKNDEVIKVNTSTIYLNYGDTLSLDDIGFSRQEPNKDTEINFNAGGDAVTSIIKYDEIQKCYIPTEKGGSTTIEITTTNRKYKKFAIDVVVGTGTEENPFYISNETQLFNIGSQYPIDAYYRLVNDIEITSSHTPIGLIDGKYYEFVGNFDGNFKTISNLQLSECNFGGLFSIIGAKGVVANLIMENTSISGNFASAGSVAGICYGTINKVNVVNSSLDISYPTANIGAVVGVLANDTNTSSTASIMRTGAYADKDVYISGEGLIGGIAGQVNGGIIHACYTNLMIDNNSNNGITGGLVGLFNVDSNSYIRESYTVCTLNNVGLVGNIAGKIDIITELNNIDKNTVLLGLYYNSDTNNNGAVGQDNYNFANATDYSVNGKTSEEMKQKNTYVYYVNSSNNLVYWDKVWYLADGQYPILAYTSDITDIEEDDNITNSPDITNPDNDDTSENSYIISSKQDLIDVFQSKSTVQGDYILNSNIDMQNYIWEPVAFQGTFKSSDGNNYTISNLQIKSSSNYVGFFSILGKSTISNIKFSYTQILEGSNQSAGILAGYISGNSNINNVDLSNPYISSNSTYAGGLIGYTSNAIISINNCDINLIRTNGVINNLGGIVGYTSINTSITRCNASGVLLNAIKRVGGITSTNYGLITSSSVGGTINSLNENSTDAYFGGISAVNYGSMMGAIASANFNIINTSNHYYFVGGLVGYNLGNIESCFVKDVENNLSINSGKSSGTVYMAGLVAYNKGNLYTSKCEITTIGNTRSTSYTAGLATYNYGGTIYACQVYSTLYGHIVAGLTLYNGNNGVIDSCFAGKSFTSRATYNGSYVTSFAYQITSGKIIDSLVTANLYCNNTSGWIAGFVGFIPYTSGMFGIVENCVADVSFNGVGTKYLDVAEDGLLKASQTTGTIKKCIISSDAEVDGVIVSEYSESKFLFITIKTYEAGSGSSYIVATNYQLHDFNTYANPEICDFDISRRTDIFTKWYYSDKIEMAVPRAVGMWLYAEG